MICSSVYRLFFIFSSLARLRENSSFNWQSFPGAGHIVAQAEKQSEHRQHLERITVEGNVHSEERGSWQAFLIAFFVLAFGGFLIWRGQSVLGTIFVGLDVASLAGIFLTGKASQRRQLAERSKAIETAVERSRSTADTNANSK
jgi:uncharacterized membrane protein